MARIQPLAIDQADSATATALQTVRRKLDTLPNVFTTFARSRVALDGYLKLSGALSAGRLSLRQREQIALAVAQVNSCDYCLSAHTAIGRQAGLGDDEIAQARRGMAADPRDDAILRFAREVTASRAEISDEQLAAVRSAGVDDGLIVEIVANIAQHLLTNYLNKIAGTDVDFPPIDLEAAA